MSANSQSGWMMKAALLVALAATLLIGFFFVGSDEASRQLWQILMICSVAVTLGLMVWVFTQTPGNIDRLKEVASLADSQTAAVVVARLADHGIKAKAVGGFTAGFQAEAPGDVKVVVNARAFPEASQIVASMDVN